VPKVSVLLTCFNHMRFLPEALDSVRAQTFDDYEIIAIDDGSSDGSREWLAGQPDVQLICNEKNLGTYATLNIALAASTGEYIAILNDDDVWKPEKLERQLDLFGAYPQIGLCHTGGYFIDAEGKQLRGSPLGFAFPRFTTGDVLLGLIYENKIIASAALVRRECFDKLGNFNSQYFGSGDWEMWFRIAEHYHVGFVDEPLTLYRVHAQNASKKLDRIWVDDQRLREWMDPRLDGMIGRFDPDDVQRAKAFNFAALGMERALNGDARGGREAFKKSLQLQPKRWKSYLRYAATYLPTPLFRRTLKM
jgi:glycosyltransferase involved in cell wall biosynthesis